MSNDVNPIVQTNPLIEAMPNEELEAYKAKFPDNESLVKLIDGILESRESQAKQAELQATFMGALAELNLPEPPQGVYNVYRAFGKVSRPLNKEERKSYLATHPEASKEELDAKRIETDDWAWGDWVINKAFAPQGKATSANKPATTKRAITVKKVEGDSLVLVGNFRSGSEACQNLKLDTGGDSAMRVLQRFGYHVQAYDGQDFLIKA